MAHNILTAHTCECVWECVCVCLSGRNSPPRQRLCEMCNM